MHVMHTHNHLFTRALQGKNENIKLQEKSVHMTLYDHNACWVKADGSFSLNHLLMEHLRLYRSVYI